MARRLEHDWWPEPLPDDVTIGDGSWVYSSYAFVHYRSEHPQAVRIGRRTGVYVGTFFDLGPEGTVDIGDYCTIAGPYFVGDVEVRIGSYVFISYGAVMADSFAAVPGTRIDPAGGGSIELEDDTWIGAHAVLLPGARLGRGAVVGTRAVVDFEVPSFAIVAGNPARVVGRAPPGGRRVHAEGAGGP